MAYKYIVTNDFHGYTKGQEITDPDEIAKVLSDNEAHVVRTGTPDDGSTTVVVAAPPPPAPDKKKGA